MTDVTVRRPTITFDLDMVRPMVSRRMARLRESGLVDAAEVERWWTRLEAAQGRVEELAPFTAIIVAGTRT